MFASLSSADGNTPLIKGRTENKVAPTAEQLARLKKRAENQDLTNMATNLGVARYIADNPFNVLRMQTTETSFNLDGIWGGNMYANAAGAILPNKITSKHNIRYVPNMNGMDLVKKIRAQLDRNGYKDVELEVIGDVPWSTVDPENEINSAGKRMYDAFGSTSRRFPCLAADHVPEPAQSGGYWPSYLFNNGQEGHKEYPSGRTIARGAGGCGGSARAAPEW